MEIVLMLLGAAVVYVALEKIYDRIWAEHLDADIHFSQTSAVRGETVDLVEVITNRKWLPLPFVNVKFSLDRSLVFDSSDGNAKISDQSYKNDVYSLLFYQRITRRIPIMCTKRGLFVIDRLDIVSKGIFMREILSFLVPVYSELLVYPKLADVSRIEIPFRKVMGDLLTRRNLYEDPFEFRGIRDYAPFDSQKDINWNATARTGELKVNLHDYTASRNACILLNLENEGMMRYDTLLEEEIAIAAGIVAKLVAEGVSVGLVSNGCDVVTKEQMIFETGEGAAHGNALYQGLARLDLEQPVKNFEEVMKQHYSRDMLYIMISTSRRAEVQMEYEKLCEEGLGSVWIQPFHAGMETELAFCPQAQSFPWEVTYDEA